MRSSILLTIVVLACQPQPVQSPAPASELPWRAATAKAMSRAAFMVDDEPLATDLALIGGDPLVAGDAPDTSIENLLDRRLSLPSRIVVGILHLPGPSARISWYASGDLSDQTQAVADSAVAVLVRAPRVERATTLPVMVVGEHYTIASLREAAARLQAHVLLVYRPSCKFYQRDPFIGAPQYRAVCTSEAVALDTRSGLLPFSTVVTREYVTQKQRGDFDESATWRRAQLQAVVFAVLEVGTRLGTFLSGVPQSP